MALLPWSAIQALPLPSMATLIGPDKPPPVNGELALGVPALFNSRTLAPPFSAIQTLPERSMAIPWGLALIQLPLPAV